MPFDRQVGELGLGRVAEQEVGHADAGAIPLKGILSARGRRVSVESVSVSIRQRQEITMADDDAKERLFEDVVAANRRRIFGFRVAQSEVTFQGGSPRA